MLTNMSRVLLQIRGDRDGAKVLTTVLDDGITWTPIGSSARTMLTPVSAQLALSPMVAQARAAGVTAIPYSAIHSYTWYEKEGRVDLTLTDGSLVYFHVKPVKRAPEFMQVFHTAYVQEKAARAARLAAINKTDTPPA
jgi:hypothetical protein